MACALVLRPGCSAAMTRAQKEQLVATGERQDQRHALTHLRLAATSTRKLIDGVERRQCLETKRKMGKQMSDEMSGRDSLRLIRLPKPERAAGA